MTDASRTPASRAETVAEAVQDRILADGAARGTRLGLRTELIERYGVSPSVMNEALRLLRDRGVVTVRPGPSGGVFVENVPAQLRLGAIDVWFSATLGAPRDLFAARAFFDGAFAALAVERAGAADLRAMSWALDEMRGAGGDAAGYLEASMRFHLAIARASRITVAVGLYETVVALLRTAMVRAAFVEPSADRVAHSLEVHEGMLAAVRDGDAVAMAKLLALHDADLRRLDADPGDGSHTVIGDHARG